MGHFAKLNNNNEVIDIVVVNDNDFTIDGIEVEEIGINFLNSIFNHTNWRQTSYNTRGGIHYLPNSNTPSSTQEKAIRWNYAGIGYIYDEVRDVFIPPSPYASWNLNEETYKWEAPIPMPDTAIIPDFYKRYNNYIWNEGEMNWELIKPFGSWLLTQGGYYISPIPFPLDGNQYKWNEDTFNWDLIS